LAWLIVAYWPGLLWLNCLVLWCFLIRLTADLLPLIGLVYCGLLAWLFVAYWSGLLARLIVTHWALTDLVPTRLIQSFLGLLSNSSTGLFCAYLRSQGTW
jgi:small-conductance mechanosensitive channel